MSLAFDHLPDKKLTRAEETALSKRHKPEDIELLVMSTMREAVVYARRVCKEHFQDDELVSLCYASLLRMAKRYDPAKSSRFFVFAKIAVRGDVMRNFRKLDTVSNAFKANPVPWYDDPKPLESAEVQSCVSEVETKDQHAYVLRVIKKCCTEREQMVFSLAYKGELGFHEIAKLLGITRSAVQASHARAVRKVRNHIAREERLLQREDFGD